MSKNAKNARKAATARGVTAMRKAGNKGPSRTKKTTTKRNTWFARGSKAPVAPAVVAEE